MNDSIIVELADRSYPIHFNSDTFSISRVGELIRNRKVVIFSNTTVSPLYLKPLNDEIKQYKPASIHNFDWKDGEQYKNIQSWRLGLDFLAEINFNRNDIIISLGGGVVCDMSGFVAASWMRGVDFIQIPTTLLAQIDASVGGKTGINHPKGKNLLGSFHQPKAVLINTQVLQTLNGREFNAGIGEAIKYGYINQPGFLGWLKQNRQLILSKHPLTLAELIKKCCQFKADIVAKDEKESGCRALLNLGHTFGHAIESLTEYKKYLHGEAVALGMVMAAECSVLLGISSHTLKDDMLNLLRLSLIHI